MENKNTTTKYVIQSRAGRYISPGRVDREVYSGTSKKGVHKFTTAFFKRSEWVVFPSKGAAGAALCRMNLSLAQYKVEEL